MSAVATVALDGLVSVQCSKISLMRMCSVISWSDTSYPICCLSTELIQSIILLDNASIHHNARTVELI